MVSLYIGGDLMRTLDGLDPLMKPTLFQCLEDIREWPHYDNYQHGHYMNENKMGYGKIKVKNANVCIITKNLDPQPEDEKFKKVWGHYDYWHTYFRGDLSQRRFEYLLELSKRHECLIEVTHEFGQPAFMVSDGGEKPPIFSGYHKGCGDEIHEIDIGSKEYSCGACGKLSFQQKMSEIVYFKSDNDNEDNYVNFGDVCRGQLGIQCQYGMYYLEGLGGYPNLSEGIRIKGDINWWHELKIHKDDVDEFVRRVRKLREESQ